MRPRFSKKALSNPGWAYAGIGFEFVGMFLACVAFGYWIDSLFWPSYHWGLFGGLFLGFFAGMFHVLLRTKEIERHSEEQQQAMSQAVEQETTHEKIERLESEIDDVSDRLRDVFGKRDTNKK